MQCLVNSLREVELGFLSSATRMNHFGLDYMVRRSTLSDANSRRTPEFFEKVYYQLYDRYKGLLSDSRPVKGIKRPLFVFVNITDAADSDHEILGKMNPASGSYVSFDMGQSNILFVGSN